VGAGNVARSRALFMAGGRALRTRRRRPRTAAFEHFNVPSPTRRCRRRVTRGAGGPAPSSRRESPREPARPTDGRSRRSATRRGAPSVRERGSTASRLDRGEALHRTVAGWRETRPRHAPREGGRGASPAFGTRRLEDQMADTVTERKISRTAARSVACPACAAEPGERCRGVRGREREANHRERVQAAEVAERVAATNAPKRFVRRTQREW
jgi:hypothetical protein